jgi:hypothetical protein
MLTDSILVFTDGAQDPLFVDFSWTAYEASSHRKPLGTHNRPPPQMTLHPMHAPGDTAAVLRMTTPWYPEEEFKNNREKAYEKLMNGFRLHCDDMQLWKDKPRGLYAKKDPYPEVSRLEEFSFFPISPLGISSLIPMLILPLPCIVRKVPQTCKASSSTLVDPCRHQRLSRSRTSEQISQYLRCTRKGWIQLYLW